MSTKVSRLVCFLLFRLLLPVILLAACVLRYNVLSFLYLVFLLIAPLLRSLNQTTIKGGSGLYLKLLIVVGSLGTLAQIVFHIVLAAIAKEDEPYGYHFSNCSTNEIIARTIAVERLDGVPFAHVLRLVLPDVGVLIAAILTFVIPYKLLNSSPQQQEEDLLPVVHRRKKRFDSVFQFIGEFLIVLFLAACGIIVPSVLSAVYFLSFLYIATWWAFYQRLGRKFAYYRFFILVWSGLHLLVLYLYQLQPFQEDWLPGKDSVVARLLGLTAVIRTDCDKPWSVEFHDGNNWPQFVNPGLLLVLYVVAAVEVRIWYHKKRQLEDDMDGNQVKRSRRQKRRSLERQVLPQQIAQEESLVGDDNPTYSTFEDRGQVAEEPDTPRMSAVFESDDEADGGVQSKPKKRKKKDIKRLAAVTVFVFVMKQSYVLSLIAMMAWSITFHSWLTFVLLLGACFIWMVPQSRRACLLCSPFIMFYGMGLLSIQFVYGMNLTELPEKVNGVSLSEIGLKKFTYPCLQLGLQIIFTSTFWLTMRQYMRERQQQKLAGSSDVPMEPIREDGQQRSFSSWLNGWIRLRNVQDDEAPTGSETYITSQDDIDGYDSNTMKIIGGFVWSLLAKYWIFVCTGMMLLISIQEVVVYRIIYLVLFLSFVLVFQLSYKLWRLTMFLFWWVVIVYSIIVLIILYTYQFKEFPGYWHNATGLSMDVLSDLGLEQYDTAGLFVRLLTPTSFLILIILQVHYFHKTFMKISDLEQSKNVENHSSVAFTTDTEGGTTTTDTEGSLFRKTKRWKRKLKKWFIVIWTTCTSVWKTVSSILWRLTEIHVIKVVAFVIIMVCVTEVSAISAVYVILLGLFLPITGAWAFMCHLCQVWTAIVMVAKMIYQLNLVEKDYWITNCTMDVANQTVNGTEPPANPFANGTINNALWVGLAKADSFSYYLQNYIGILLILAFERIVHYHQIQYCNLSGLPKPAKGIIFLEIKRENADRNLLNCSKFFANYFFYKYGLEICYIMFAVTISVRVDAYSVLYAVLLGILLFLPRRGNARIWPLFTIILAVLLPIQFLLCLGLPTGLCQEYPWDSNSAVTLDLEKWLFLPDYYNPLDSYKLIADFFLLLFMCLQWNVFRMEMSNHWKEYGGGDNGDILPELVAKTPIPVADFTSSARSYLDVLKNVFFTYMFWVTLFVVFMAGLSRINIFSMGYVISVFIFMWYGQEFLLKPLDKIRQRWKLLIGYTFLVMFLKAALQLLGCVYITYVYTDFCWLIQLLGLTCLSPSRTYNPGSGDCIVEEDDTGLKWDVVCFTFLLLQLRIYNSHYFRHIVSTAEAQARLSSRGAELINSILIKEVQEQREEEKKVLQNIKKKMEYLKEKQKNKTSEDYKEPDDHFQAIRSGDYYLFDEESDNEEDKEHPTSITIGMDKSDEEGKDGGLDPIQLISTAIESGAKAAVDQAETDDEDGNKASQQQEGEAKEDDKGDDADDEDDDDNGKDNRCDTLFNIAESMFSKLKTVMTLIMKLLESLADTLIGIFNNISKNYRLVAESLEKDMQIEKEKIAASNKGLSETDQRIPLDSSAEDGGATEARDGDETDAADLVEIQLVPADGEFSHGDDEVDGLAKSKQAKFERNKSKIYLLFEATLYVMVAKSEIVCYFLMILNQILYASLLSLPLPLMVFLWGMLSVPRPSKTFWITIITYTEAVVVVKYLFQFNFFFWNEDTLIQLSPFWPPRIIGVEKKSNYAVADLVLLLALFIHRSILKRYGLWKDAEDITADLSKVEKGMSPPTTPTTVPEREDIISSLEDGSGSIQESTDVQSSGESKDGTKSKQKEKKKSSKSKMLLEPFKKFYAQLTNAAYNATTDVYASMFFCDFINFLIIVFGYWAFGPAESASGDVTSYIRDDRVPVLFLIMLLTQFILIIIDRALYLRKFIPGKFVFQIFLVIIIHVWMFFILPYVTERKFADNAPAQLFYFVKCVYFGLSAYQIRSSYPTRILGNFLTKKYNYLNLFLFKGFLAIPFLLELRVLMDWIWTDSTMAIGSWLQMEDIYANIYMLKCWREIERKYPTPRAIKKRALIKYGVGGLLLFLVIFIIWFPLVLFSFANTVYIANPPYECTSTIAVSGFQPLVHIQAQGNSIQRFSANDYSTLQNDFKSNPSAAGFINGYEASDITRIKLNGDSTSVWGISPPNRQELIQYLNDTSSSAKMEFDLTFTRDPTSGEAGQTLSNQFTLGLDRDTRKRLADMIHSNTAGVDSVIIRGLFPRYLHLSSKGSESVNTVLGVDSSNISASLRTEGNTSIPGSVLEWWQVKECEFGVVDCSTTSDDLVIVTFNDRVAPAGLSFISGYGIIGLYITFILLIGRFLRLSTTGLAERITYLELPYVDNILRLCLNIYLVREMQEYHLEEDMYAKLLFVYRSAETRIKWTRMPPDLIITDAKKND